MEVLVRRVGREAGDGGRIAGAPGEEGALGADLLRRIGGVEAVGLGPRFGEAALLDEDEQDPLQHLVLVAAEAVRSSLAEGAPVPVERRRERPRGVQTAGALVGDLGGGGGGRPERLVARQRRGAVAARQERPRLAPPRPVEERGIVRGIGGVLSPDR